MKGSVQTIVEPMQERTSKAGKKYRAQKVELMLEDGSVVSTLSFEELAVGSEVEMEKKGDFWSIKVAPSAKLEFQERILDHLKFIVAQNRKIIELLEPVEVSDTQLAINKARSGYDKARATADSLRSEAEPLPEYQGEEYLA